MTTYICFLRGVNVGGNKMVKMTSGERMRSEMIGARANKMPAATRPTV